KDLVVSGEAVGAEPGLTLGLMNRRVATVDLQRVVSDLARTVGGNARLSVRAMKAFVQRLGEERRLLRRDDLEALFRQVRESADAPEGLAGQRGRRRARFPGAPREKAVPTLLAEARVAS